MCCHTYAVHSRKIALLANAATRRLIVQSSTESQLIVKHIFISTDPAAIQKLFTQIFVAVGCDTARSLIRTYASIPCDRTPVTISGGGKLSIRSLIAMLQLCALSKHLSQLIVTLQVYHPRVAIGCDIVGKFHSHLCYNWFQCCSWPNLHICHHQL